ncbi:trans-aconitate 2-methyltransferase [Sphingomonas sp. MMS24-J13]|uniref:trans-aconitate 2-methyltransferase n=1 Tax=Sphingomonas sp. MMS24-J13 TaxID=3238686 RepID=UPI003850D4F2
MSWSARQYVKFEDERTRPVRDLIARIPNREAGVAVDLGCGPGNSTELLLGRFPEAQVVGIDNSADMIAAARKRMPDTAFELHDITAWSRAEGAVDVILSNAALQWVPDHGSLLPALVGRLKTGGALAVQMPHNLDEPAHRAMRIVAADGPWGDRLAAAARPADGQHEPAYYYDVLGAAGATVDVWMTIYHHVMPDVAAVVEWFKGSALRPFLAPLDADEQQAFLAHYLEAISPLFPPRHDGSVLLPFPRLFFVATRV